MALPQQIAIARKKKGLTQEQLAEMTNITVRTIQRIESGESSPRSFTIKVLAEALDTNFDDLNHTGETKENLPTPPITPSASVETQDQKHFITMLCLSCFSFLVIPFVHFLVPAHLLKKSKELNPKVIAFGRTVIRGQVYWLIILHIFLLFTLAYNFTRAVYFQKSYLLNYMWPFLLMYIVNIVLITRNLWQARKAGFMLSQASTS